jgi:hypothetical protein
MFFLHGRSGGAPRLLLGWTEVLHQTIGLCLIPNRSSATQDGGFVMSKGIEWATSKASSGRWLSKYPGQTLIVGYRCNEKQEATRSSLAHRCSIHLLTVPHIHIGGTRFHGRDAVLERAQKRAFASMQGRWCVVIGTVTRAIFLANDRIKYSVTDGR